MSDSELRAFWHQRWHSRRRGIAFYFTFDEWIEWWENQLGPQWFSKRGTKAHQYVMGRKGDEGPYMPSNVLCLTMAQNTSDAHKGKPSGYLGKKHSAKTKTLLRKLNLGRPGTYGMLGKKHSPETIAKMKASALERRT